MSSALHPPTLAQRWRSPAVVVVCACLIALLGFGIRSSFGLFTEPLSSDRGWSREVFALAIAIQNLLWGLGQPLAGALADRFGSFRVLAAGGLVYALGVALMGLVSTPSMMYLSAGVLVGLGLAGASFTIVIAALSRRVPASRRSWVVGLVTATGSLGQFLFAPLGQGFIAAYGWSTALLLLASFMLLVPLLASSLGGQRERTPADEPELSFRDALRQAFGHGSYLLLTAGFFVCGFHVAFIATHLPPYLVDLGLGATLAAWALALVGLFNVVGSYMSGVLGGRYSKRYLLSAIYLGRAAIIALFISLPVTQTSVLLFAAAMGLLWLSTVPPTSALVALMFGTRHMGVLFGFVFFSHQLGAFLGVWLGGLLYESSGGYDAMWWISVALGIAAAALHWPIVERRAPDLAPA